MVLKITSSGQSGVDRAALDVAMENDIACGGWCPQGRRAEDGPIDAKYPLVEMASPSPTRVIEANIRDSDGTLVLGWGPLGGNTLKAAAVAGRLKKPLFIVNMLESPTVENAVIWATHYNVRVLNVVGPKAGEFADAYTRAKEFLTRLLVGDEEPVDSTSGE
jgi:hypothetical protein